MRGIGGVVALVAVLPLTAGCTVPIVGATGIGVDDKGALVGYVAVCHDHIDGVSLYTDDEPDGDEVGRWTVRPAARGNDSWSLRDPDAPWAVDQPLRAVQPGVVYTMYGWTDDNTSSTASVSFTMRDLASLTPGQLRWEGKTSRDGFLVETVTSEEVFRSSACRLFGD